MMIVNRFRHETLDHPGYNFHVELDERFGWLLKFEMSHKQAEKVWEFISERDNFYDLYHSSGEKAK